ncbi:hypothetical protein [Streptomyces sp. NPDC059949]|uniref:hypothetical protein n=1 Tax=Streptomyces sp. NPDC059949 TaxID=3347013 RepID=UPI00364A2AD3
MTARSAGKAPESWEQFKVKAFGARTEVIEGVEIIVPADIPLNFTAAFSALGPESGIDDFGESVTLLYGEGVFDQWVDRGMGAIGLLTALMWGYMQGGGKDVTFQDAFQVVTSDDPGKAVTAVVGNRAARRAQSSGTGGRSSRTSAASTASPRTKSRT